MAIPFRAITTFHATVSAAGRQPGVTPCAVSRQLSLLETYVGTALLLKVGRGVKWRSRSSYRRAPSWRHANVASSVISSGVSSLSVADIASAGAIGIGSMERHGFPEGYRSG